MIGGAGALALVDVMPALAWVLGGLAVLAWSVERLLRHRKRSAGCAGGAACGCQDKGGRQETAHGPLQSQP
ncbi:hypothetical protein AB0C10_11535 [Microbispora amethystogenes]|uniref:hypothetical protein n=1 Tax=Microbispora amethystogenes TaxID=1427754 RepID=UPI0033D72D7F